MAIIHDITENLDICLHVHEGNDIRDITIILYDYINVAMDNVTVTLTKHNIKYTFEDSSTLQLLANHVRDYLV